MPLGTIMVAGFAVVLVVAGDRLTIEVYYDILSAIHLIRRAGERTTLSNIGHRARVPNNRLKIRMSELVTLGLVKVDRSQVGEF
jgi:RIO-like serine/threonine protein kinase